MSIGTVQSSMQFIANILKKNAVCRDVQPLRNAFQSTNSGKYKSRLKLEFQPKTLPRNTIPNTIKNIRVILEVSIEEDFNEIHDKKTYNTIVPGEYNCSVLLVGKDNDGLDYVSGLHIDYDPDSSRCDYIHPHFHLTFGGDKMKKYFEREPNADFGRALMLTSPRIAHPPLDIFLAIDFILSNYFEKDIHQKITKESQYKTAIRNSQERLWRPYMLSIAGHWCRFRECTLLYDDGVSKANYPHLITN